MITLGRGGVGRGGVGRVGNPLDRVGRVVVGLTGGAIVSLIRLRGPLGCTDGLFTPSSLGERGVTPRGATPRGATPRGPLDGPLPTGGAIGLRGPLGVLPTVSFMGKRGLLGFLIRMVYPIIFCIV